MAHEQDLARWRARYARLLRLYPERHRNRFGEGMAQTFNDLLCEHRRAGEPVAGIAVRLSIETGAAIMKANLEHALQHRYFVRPAVVTGGLLLIPLVMTVLDRNKPLGEGWRWEPMSFLVMGVLLFGAGLAYEFFADRLKHRASRVLLFAAVLGVVVAIWSELAVDAVSQLLAWLFG